MSKEFCYQGHDGKFYDTSLHETVLNNKVADLIYRQMAAKRAMARGVDQYTVKHLYNLSDEQLQKA